MRCPNSVASDPVAWHRPEAQSTALERVALPPMPLPVVKHTQLGDLYDRFAMHSYAMRFLMDCEKAAAAGVKALDPTKPQHCRLGAPVPGFPTQECNCVPGACRLGKDDPAHGVEGRKP